MVVCIITCVMSSAFFLLRINYTKCKLAHVITLVFCGSFELFDDGDGLGVWMYSSVRIFIAFYW